jgi:hypothetical protein
LTQLLQDEFATAKFEIQLGNGKRGDIGKRSYAPCLLNCYISIIDIHDLLRQGSRVFHVRWKTTTWWHRLYFTFRGVIIVNVYYASKYEHKQIHGDTDKMGDCMDRTDTLAYEMIHNTFDGVVKLPEGRHVRGRELVPPLLMTSNASFMSTITF